MNCSLPGNETKQSDGESNESSLTNNLNSINKTSLISLSQFTDLWRRMCQSNHDEASQFFYVVTKAADIASNFSTATENSDSISSSSNTFSYLTKNSDYPNSNPSSTTTATNALNSSSYNNNNFNNNKKSTASKNSARTFILPEDLVILIQDVVDSHPGLGFLKEATEFHSRYVHTVSCN